MAYKDSVNETEAAPDDGVAIRFVGARGIGLNNTGNDTTSWVNMLRGLLALPYIKLIINDSAGNSITYVPIGVTSANRIITITGAIIQQSSVFNTTNFVITGNVTSF
jgi:hypothetical protein